MPLSEGEQRRLDEIERALMTEDPSFASNIAIDQFRRHHSLLAGIVFVIGMVGLVAGLVVTDAALWFGVVIALAGLGAMVAGVYMYTRFRARR